MAFVLLIYITSKAEWLKHRPRLGINARRTVFREIRQYLVSSMTSLDCCLEATCSGLIWLTLTNVVW